MTREEVTIQSLLQHIEALEETIKALEQNQEHLVNESGDLVKDLVKDTISRQAVLKKIYALWNSYYDKYYCMESLRDFVVEAPSITPTRKKGKWIAEYDSDGHFRTYHCSNCKNLQGYTSNFCEECGSENREVEE